VAVRQIIILCCLLLSGLLSCPDAEGCFGPKLFVGVSDSPEEEVLYALVTLYIKEKTGVESTRVEIAPDQKPLGLIAGEQVDLAFVATEQPLRSIVFRLEGMPALAAGGRPLDDLQFTTVLPAVKKLNSLLSRADVEGLLLRVKAGESAMAAARHFLMQRRWI